MISHIDMFLVPAVLLLLPSLFPACNPGLHFTIKAWLSCLMLRCPNHVAQLDRLHLHAPCCPCNTHAAHGGTFFQE